MTEVGYTSFAPNPLRAHAGPQLGQSFGRYGKTPLLSHSATHATGVNPLLMRQPMESHAHSCIQAAVRFWEKPHGADGVTRGGGTDAVVVSLVVGEREVTGVLTCWALVVIVKVGFGVRDVVRSCAVSDGRPEELVVDAGHVAG